MHLVWGNKLIFILAKNKPINSQLNSWSYIHPHHSYYHHHIFLLQNQSFHPRNILCSETLGVSPEYKSIHNLLNYLNIRLHWLCYHHRIIQVLHSVRQLYDWYKHLMIQLGLSNTILSYFHCNTYYTFLRGHHHKIPKPLKFRLHSYTDFYHIYQLRMLFQIHKDDCIHLHLKCYHHHITQEVYLQWHHFHIFARFNEANQ